MKEKREWWNQWEKERAKEIIQYWSKSGGKRNEEARIKGLIGKEIKGKRILDAGCGPGRYALALEGYKEYLGVDTSKSFMSEAQKRFKDKENVFFLRGDIENLAFSRKFDYVLCIAVIRHLPTLKGLRVLRKLLTYGETIAITVKLGQEKVYTEFWNESYKGYGALDHPYSLNQIESVIGKNYETYKITGKVKLFLIRGEQKTEDEGRNEI